MPAWLPALDRRSLRRRSAAYAATLFAAVTLFSWVGAKLILWLPAPFAAETAALANLMDASLPTDAAQARVAVVPAGLAPNLDSVFEWTEQPKLSAMSRKPASSLTLDVVTGRVADGGTVAAALGDQSVDSGMIHTIAVAMRPVFDFRRARPGDFFALIKDSEGKLLSFQYQRGRSEIYRLERRDDGALVPRREEAPLERRVVQLAGIIERSLFESLRAQGETPNLVNDFVDIFVWDFDFARETRPGDEYRLVFEKFYDKDGFVRYGQILAAQYATARQDLTAVYFEDGDGYGDYYTPDGRSVRRSFLRAPLRYSRISSRYSNSRYHPILKVRRPHQGIDYAAPSGTPIWAVADGEVIYKGWNGGFGRLVKVRHRNGYTSFYGHLSRYADLKVGDRVRQKQVIGYVGSSGLSTGPHLDFRLRLAGEFVDPMKVKFPKGDPISVKARTRFEETAKSRLAELNAAAPPVVLEAAM